MKNQAPSWQESNNQAKEEFFMGMLPREQLRQLIMENDIKDVNGIYDTLKDMFQDVLQEMLEAEMDTTLTKPRAKTPLTSEMGIPQKV
jgi:hypothetical protein